MTFFFLFHGGTLKVSEDMDYFRLPVSDSRQSPLIGFTVSHTPTQTHARTHSLVHVRHNQATEEPVGTLSPVSVATRPLNLPAREA